MRCMVSFNMGQECQWYEMRYINGAARMHNIAHQTYFDDLRYVR